MDVYLIRHTTPDIETGTVYGQLDIGLRKTFLQEAALVLGQLPSRFDKVYSSPLTRCLSLAELLPGKSVIDKRLVELNFGEWEGKKWGEIDRSSVDEWMTDYLNLSPPGGETMLELQRRTLRFWTDLTSSRDGTVAVVTHAGVIRTLTAHLKQIPLTSAFDIEIPFGAVLRVDEVSGELPCRHNTLF